MVVANLEGPITRSASVSVGTKPQEADNFALPPGHRPHVSCAAQHLAISTGNNHIRNFGREGEETAQYLREAGVGFAGICRTRRLLR